MGATVSRETQTIANSLYRLVLECFLYWAKWYPNDHVFPGMYEMLRDNGVVFPSMITYFKKSTESPRKPKGLESAPQKSQIYIQESIFDNWESIKKKYKEMLMDNEQDHTLWNKKLSKIENYFYKCKERLAQIVAEGEENEMEIQKIHKKLDQEEKEAEIYLDTCKLWLEQNIDYKNFQAMFISQDQLPPYYQANDPNNEKDFKSQEILFSPQKEEKIEQTLDVEDVTPYKRNKMVQTIIDEVKR